MKKIILWICLAAAFVMLSGCSVKTVQMQEPVSVYYCASPISYHSTSGILQTEKQEFQGGQNDLRGFLNKYLSGPSSPKLATPFPANGSILSVERSDEEMNVCVSVQFLTLTQSELILAYACLSMTIFEVTDAEIINLHIYGTNADRNVVTMTRDNLWFTDVADIE